MLYPDPRPCILAWLPIALRMRTTFLQGPGGLVPVGPLGFPSNILHLSPHASHTSLPSPLTLLWSLLPQGLCTYCSLCIECFALPSSNQLLCILKNPLVCHLPREADVPRAHLLVMEDSQHSALLFHDTCHKFAFLYTYLINTYPYH